jgi:uncharacterized protein with PIN domain
MRYSIRNRPQSEQTASPNKYPQKMFNNKSCKKCNTVFAPKAPSHLYCSQECAYWGVVTRYLKRNYGITYTDYMVMHKEQNGKCSICNQEGFAMNPNQVKLVVDHDHETGEVRGLLCHNCNRALGLFKDNVSFLQTAIKYLDKSKKA